MAAGELCLKLPARPRTAYYNSQINQTRDVFPSSRTKLLLGHRCRGRGALHVARQGADASTLSNGRARAALLWVLPTPRSGEAPAATERRPHTSVKVTLPAAKSPRARGHDFDQKLMKAAAVDAVTRAFSSAKEGLCAGHVCAAWSQAAASLGAGRATAKSQARASPLEEV